MIEQKEAISQLLLAIDGKCLIDKSTLTILRNSDFSEDLRKSLLSPGLVNLVCGKTVKSIRDFVTSLNLKATNSSQAKSP